MSGDLPARVRTAILQAGQGQYLSPIVSTLPSDAELALLPAGEATDAYIRSGIDVLRSSAARSGITWGSQDTSALVTSLEAPIVEIAGVVAAVRAGRSPDAIQIASTVTGIIGGALVAAAAFSAVPIVGWIAAAVTALFAGAIALAKWLRKRKQMPVFPTLAYDHDADQRTANILLEGLAGNDWTWVFLPRASGEWSTVKAEGYGPRKIHRIWRIGRQEGSPTGGGVELGTWRGGAQQWSWQRANREDSLAEYASEADYRPLTRSVASTALELVQAPGRQLYAVDWTRSETAWRDWKAAAPTGVQRGTSSVVHWDGLRERQRQGLGTLLCAYVSRDDPAIRGSADLRAALEDRRRELLQHPARRDVDLAIVPDAGYRQALFQSRLGLAARPGSDGPPDPHWSPKRLPAPRLPPIPGQDSGGVVKGLGLITLLRLIAGGS
jgi:hypothetical protein